MSPHENPAAAELLSGPALRDRFAAAPSMDDVLAELIALGHVELHEHTDSAGALAHWCLLRCGDADRDPESLMFAGRGATRYLAALDCLAMALGVIDDQARDTIAGIETYLAGA